MEREVILGAGGLVGLVGARYGVEIGMKCIGGAGRGRWKGRGMWGRWKASSRGRRGEGGRGGEGGGVG